MARLALVRAYRGLDGVRLHQETTQKEDTVKRKILALWDMADYLDLIFLILVILVVSFVFTYRG